MDYKLFTRVDFSFLTFDLISVTKHGLTYTTLLGVHLKEHFAFTFSIIE
jgi:hypothetical protein